MTARDGEKIPIKISWPAPDNVLGASPNRLGRAIWLTEEQAQDFADKLDEEGYTTLAREARHLIEVARREAYTHTDEYVKQRWRQMVHGGHTLLGFEDYKAGIAEGERAKGRTESDP